MATGTTVLVFIMAFLEPTPDVPVDDGLIVMVEPGLGARTGNSVPPWGRTAAAVSGLVADRSELARTLTHIQATRRMPPGPTMTTT
jgi:hypothetical protein